MKEPTPFVERLEKAQQGDRSAEDRLWAQNRSWMGRVVRRYAGDRSPRGIGVSDIVQSAMVAASQHLRTFSATSPRKFYAWLKRILINKAHERARRPGITAEQLFNDGTPSGLARPSSTQSSRDERLDHLAFVLGELAPDERRLIELRYLTPDGASQEYKELAEEFGTTEDALRQRVDRLRERIRKGIELKIGIEDRRIPENYAQLIWLKRFHRLSFEEMSRRLGWPEDAVRGILAAAERAFEQSQGDN